MRYTEKVHAKRLVKMMAKEKPCACCPAQIHFMTHSVFIKGASHLSACRVCRVFVGLNHYNQGCPCYLLGKEEALEKTREVLKEKGYL